MTKIKNTETKIIQDGKTTVEKTQYYEVGVHEVDKMLQRVAEGEDEDKLRDALIKNSGW